jgi:hypothetical protein
MMMMMMMLLRLLLLLLLVVVVLRNLWEGLGMCLCCFGAIGVAWRGAAAGVYHEREFFCSFFFCAGNHF